MAHRYVLRSRPNYSGQAHLGSSSELAVGSYPNPQMTSDSPDQSVTIDIEGHRTESHLRNWDLPPWGHPLAQGVMPLFVTFEDRLFPVGTAFTIGRAIRFVVTAAHNVKEAWRFEKRLSHLLIAQSLPSSIDLKHAGLSVLYHRQDQDGRIGFAIWPLETVDGAPPTDVVIGHPTFSTGLPTLVNRLRFDLPERGEKMWCVGYSEFKFPSEGISLDLVRGGRFDWRNDYGHRFTVVEGFVECVFIQRFAKAFVDGPCFMLDSSIAHGMSGGPVLSTDGAIRGINSAGAASFLNRPASIASLLYPLLPMNLRFGLSFGPQFRINASRAFIELVTQDSIPSDRSEERLGLQQDCETGSLLVSPTMPISLSGHVYDDFDGFQRGVHASTQTGPVFRIRRLEREQQGEDLGN